jgi:hypothetical protein
MAAHPIRYKITPAEKRLENIDDLEHEVRRLYASGDLTSVEFREHLFTLSLKRQRAYASLQRAKGWSPDAPDPAPIPTPEPVGNSPPEPVKASLKQRVVGAVVLFGLLYLISYLIIFLKWASSGG